MFSKNLKYYRLRKQMSKKELAEKVNVTPMAITNYENGDRKPNMETMKALADALDVRVTDFLAVRNGRIVFNHGGFRKSNSLSVEQQEYVREFVEEYFSRFMTAVEILGGDVLPAAPQCHALPLSGDAEKNAAALRTHLGFAESGPIEDLTGKLENKGILVRRDVFPTEFVAALIVHFSGRHHVLVEHLHVLGLHKVAPHRPQLCCRAADLLLDL